MFVDDTIWGCTFIKSSQSFCSESATVLQGYSTIIQLSCHKLESIAATTAATEAHFVHQFHLISGIISLKHLGRQNSS